MVTKRVSYCNKVHLWLQRACLTVTRCICGYKAHFLLQQGVFVVTKGASYCNKVNLWFKEGVYYCKRVYLWLQRFFLTVTGCICGYTVFILL